MTSHYNSSPYNFNKSDEPTSNVGLYGQARLSFIRKVYSVVGIQLATTAIFTYLAIMSQSFYIFNLNRSWPSIIAIIVCIVSQLTVLWGRSNKTTSFYALAAFTFAETFLVARICSNLVWDVTKHKIVFDNEAARMIGTAAFLTIALVGILSFFAFYTKKDYTMGSALFSMACSSLMLLGLVYMFSRNSFIHSLYIYLGLVAFGFYLVIDTQRIVGGKRMQLKTDEYMIGAMLIYADIIVIFLKILAILGKENKKDKK